MITKITGTLAGLDDDAAILTVPPFEYLVYIPECNRLELQMRIGDAVSLHTIHDIEGGSTGSKMVPRLTGFLRQAEREFFELFCQVDGIGVKKALRAMSRQVRDIATDIEQQDVAAVSSLPGIGPAMADRVIAKLRRKMPRFALMVGTDRGGASVATPDVIRDTFQSLLLLGHNDHEARRLIDGATTGKKKYKSVDELIRAIYDRSREDVSTPEEATP